MTGTSLIASGRVPTTIGTTSLFAGLELCGGAFIPIGLYRWRAPPT